MKNQFLTLLAVLNILLAADSAPKLDSPFLHAGCVDLASGQFVFSETQLQIDGPVPYDYGWSYSSQKVNNILYSDLCKGFYLNNKVAISDFKPNKGFPKFKYYLGEYPIQYKIVNKGRPNYPRDFEHLGWCQASTGDLSANTNIFNIGITLKNDNRFEVSLSDGTKQILGRPQFGFKDYFPLLSEFYPTGVEIHYEYGAENRLPTKIAASKGKETFWTLQVDQQKDFLTVNDTRGNWVRYNYFPSSQLLNSIEFPDRPTLRFGGYQQTLDKSVKDSLVREIQWPNGGKLAIEYNKGFVQSLAKTFNHSKKPETLYRYKFEEEEVFSNPKLIATATDPYGNTESVRSSSDQRPEMKCKGERSLDVLKSFYFWGKRKTEDKGRLLGKLDLSHHNILFNEYFYDSKGNIKREVRYGHFTSADSYKNVLPSLRYKLIDFDEYPFRKKESHEDFTSKFTRYETYEKHYKYNKLNQLTQISDGHGLDHRFEYDENSLLKRKMVMNGKEIEQEEKFTYNSWLMPVLIESITPGLSHCYERTERITDPKDPAFSKAKSVTVGYMENGVEIPLRKTVFQYAPCGKVASESTLGSLIQYEYDEHHRLVCKCEADGTKTYYTYDDNYNIIAIEIPSEGIKTEFDYDLGNRKIAETLFWHNEILFEQKFVYDALDQLIESSDPLNGKIKRSYDCMGFLSAETRESGEAFKWKRDGFGTLLSETLPSGRTTNYTHNSYGQIFTIVHPDNTADIFEYYVNGSIKRHQINGGAETLYWYDALGRLIKKTTREPLAKVKKTESWEYAGDAVREYSDGLGNVFYYTYDLAGRLIKEDIRGSHESRTIKYGYDAMGRRNQTETRFSVETKTFDVKGREIAREERNQQGQLLAKEEKEYDYRGRVTAHRVYFEESSFQETIYAYDPLGRIVYQKNPDGLEIFTDYEFCRPHLKKTSIDSTGLIRVSLFDGENRLLSETTSSEDRLLSCKKITYDPDGRKILEVHDRIVEGEKQGEYRLSWSYDLAGHVIMETTQEGRFTSYEYDQYGRLVNITPPAGIPIAVTSTQGGTILTRKSEDGTIDDLFEYDEAFRTIRATSHGLVTERVYDSFGHLLMEKLGNGLELQYSYFGNGQIHTIILPESHGEIRYDWDGPLLSEVTRSGPISYSIPIGNYDLLKRPKLVGAVTNEFEENGKLSSLSHPLFSQTNFSYGIKGELLGYDQSDTFGFVSKNFSYTPLNELKEESGRFDRSYSWDSLTNRREIETNSYNELVSDHFKYDRGGRLITMNGEAEIDLFYDALGRMTKTVRRKSESKSTQNYFYDAFGRLIALSKLEGKTPESAESRFLFWEDKEIGEVDKSGQLVNFRALLPGKSETGSTLAAEIKGKLYFPIQNAFGSISCVADESGNLIASYDYDAFGMMGLQEGITIPWGFCGKRVGETTGLVNFGKRFYSPQLGRFTTPDPLSTIDGPNLYAYCRGNPLSYTDHQGTFLEASCLLMIDIARMPFSKNRRSKILRFDPDEEIKEEDITPTLREKRKKKLCFTNGIYTSEEGALESAKIVSRNVGDRPVDIIYNGDNKFKLSECFMLKWWKKPNPAVNLTRDYYNKEEFYSPDSKHFHVSHSQGAIVTKQGLSPAIKQKTHFVGIAPADTMSDEGCLRSRSFCSRFDPIPFYNLGNLLRNSRSIQWIPAKSWNPLAEHSFSNPSYERCLRREGEIFESGCYRR